GAQPSIRTNQHANSIGGRRAKDVADKAAVVHVISRDVRADTNNVIGRGDAAAGTCAYGCVAVAGDVSEREITGGRVVASSGLAIERAKTGGRVVNTGGVRRQCAPAEGAV